MIFWSSRDVTHFSGQRLCSHRDEEGELSEEGMASRAALSLAVLSPKQTDQSPTFLILLLICCIFYKSNWKQYVLFTKSWGK